MRVFILTPFFWQSSRPSGIANSVHNIVNSIKNKYEISILSSNVGIDKKRQNKFISSNLTIDFYKVVYSANLLFSFDFFRKCYCKVKNCDIIIINEYFSSNVLFLLIINNLIFKKKVIFFPRGSLIRDKTFSYKKYLFDKLMLNFFKKSVSKTIFTSEYELNNSPDFQNKEIVSNCFDPTNSTLSFSNYTNNYGKYFIYVNEISKDKGFDFLIESWKKSNLKSNVKLLVVGQINKGYIENFKIHQNFFTKFNIIYLGVIQGSYKDFLISKAECSLLTSYSENFSNVVIESLSFGTPVLATYGTPWKILNDYKCGYYIDHNIDEFTISLKKYLSLSENEKLLMKKRAFKLFESKYSIDYFSIVINKILKKI